MKTRKIILTSLIGLFLIFAIQAQSVSAQKEGTVGLFSSESDSVTALSGWSSILFDKIFLSGSYGYLQGQGDSTGAGTILNPNTLNASALFRIGEAKNPESEKGPVKIGIGYTGAFGNDLQIIDTTTKTDKILTRTFPFLHNLNILIGFPNKKTAVRIGMNIGGANNEVTNTTKTENSTNDNTLSFKPSIAFGTVITKGYYSFSPTVEGALSITNGGGSAAHSYKGSKVGPGIGSNGKEYENTRIYTKYTPSANIGLGISFPSEGKKTKLSSSFSYAFSMSIQPTKSERVIQNGILTEAIYKSDKNQNHNLSAGVTAQRDLSPEFSLKGNAKLSATYEYDFSGGSISNTMDSSKSKQSIDTRTFTLLPTASGAATYNITSKVSWFGGVAFRPIMYRFTKEDKYDEGVSVGDERHTTTHMISKPLLTQLGTGFNFQPSQKLTIQCAVSLAPREGSEFRTISDIFSGNIRLSLTYKDLPNE